MPVQPKVCLVLGGGGARGFSHLGVLQVLEREGISVDCIVGTSVGAFVGAVYCLEPDALLQTRHALAYLRSEAFEGHAFKKILLKSDDVERNLLQSILSNIRKGYVFSNLLRRPGILRGEMLAELIEDLVPEKSFSDTELPFAVPALDIRSGEDVLLTEGSLRDAVLASSSVPGFFPPVEYNGRLLVDPGVVGPVPVNAAVAQFQPDVVIAVDISSYLEKLDKADRGLDVLLRVESIACARLNAMEVARADVVIEPSVGQKYWSDFSDLEMMVNEGVLATQAKIGEIRAAVEKRRGKVRAFLRRVTSASGSARD